MRYENSTIEPLLELVNATYYYSQLCSNFNSLFPQYREQYLNKQYNNSFIHHIQHLTNKSKQRYACIHQITQVLPWFIPSRGCVHKDLALGSLTMVVLQFSRLALTIILRSVRSL